MTRSHVKLRNFLGDTIYRLDNGESDVFQTETRSNREALPIRLNITNVSRMDLESLRIVVWQN